MRLQSQISREYKGNKYEKFWIVIPSKIIEKLGWKSGEDLEAEVKKDKLIVEKDQNEKYYTSIKTYKGTKK